MERITAKVFMLALLVAAVPSVVSAARSICDAIPGNLVVNCGFETGAFPPWILSGQMNNMDIQSTSAPGPNSGTYYLDAGAIGSDGIITQTIPTVPGQTYTISFYFATGGGSPSDFFAFFNGVQLYSEVNPSAHGYQLHTFTAVATASSAQLQFRFRDDPTFEQFDDVSVVGPTTQDAGFQVHYSANLNIGESYIDIANDGANGASLLGPGFGGAAGNICVNVYAFDPNEELVSCCSCLVTPDQTVNLGVNADLTSKTLTGVVPTSVTVKLVATLAGAGGSGTGTVCNNSAASITGPAQLVVGMAAWGTTLHQTQTTGTYATTETPFTAAPLNAAELSSIVGRCAAIIGNASGFGICTSCRNGALGGQKL